MVFLKLATRPLLSVSLPSSSTCNKILNTSGCAFSISSSRITEYGFRLTASVNCPPSSYPTYPGGAPISLLTVCFSWYSLISIRTKASSLLNKYAANALASSVLPTPVVPKKINEPMGLLGSESPALLLRIASDIAPMASSCPTTRWCNSPSRFSNFSRSLCNILCTGIPVHLLTTSAISSLVTSSFTSELFACLACNSVMSICSSSSTVFVLP